MSWSEKIFNVLQMNFPGDTIELIDPPAWMATDDEPVDIADDVKFIRFNGKDTDFTWPTNPTKEFWGTPSNMSPDSERSFAEDYIGSLQFDLNLYSGRWEISNGAIYDTMSGEMIELQTLIIPTFM